MDTLEEIGPLLGLAAFAGLAVLVFLTFQQARHLRRLRDWAGRAPERAAAEAAARAALKDVEAETEVEQEVGAAEDFDAIRTLAGEGEPRFPGLRSRWAALRAWGRELWAEIDRRMPVDPKMTLGGVAAILLGVGIATGAFGLLGDEAGTGTRAEQARNGTGDGTGSGGGEGRRQRAPRVAVLNGTAPPGGTGVPGVADRVSADVRSAGFRVVAVDNAGSYPTTVAMFGPGEEDQAGRVADELTALLGSTDVAEMTPEIEAVANGADVAIVIGQDNAGI